jgi:hypothetical protein
MSIVNRPSLSELSNMPISDVVALPADVLALLHEDAEAALRSAKASKDWIDGAIARRFSEQSAAQRRAEGKDTGTARFQDGPVIVVADLPKRVEWDQASLADLVERIKADGEDPREYVDISFKVSERKYTAWPSHIQSAFAEARTVRTGKETFKLILAEDGQ